jgi:hypothetical protein
METVVATRTFDGDVKSLVEYCRTMRSRENWPGAVPSYESGYTLIYTVGMNLSGAAFVDIEIDEKLGEVEERSDGSVRFATTQRVTWPTGHADANTDYLFTPGEDGVPNTVQFTYRYEPPSTKLVKTKALPAFHAGMEAVAAIYLKGLAKSFSHN